MALCIFRFMLDLNLTFPQKIYFYTKRDDIDVLLRFQRIKGKKIVSFTDDLDWINDKNESVFIGAPNVSGEKIPFRQYKKKADGDLPISGIIDEVYYTIIEVIFKITKIALLLDDKYKIEKQEWIQDVLANFIDNYTAVTEDVSFARRVIFQPLLVEVLGSEEDYGFPNAFISELRFQNIGTQINWQDPYFTGYIKQDVSSDQIGKISNRLDSPNTEVKLFQRLLLDAKEQAFISKNYDISIILTENGFEVFLQSILVEYCQDKKIKKLFVGKNKHQKEKDYIEAITNGNVREDLMSNYLKYLTGKSIAGNTKYNDWYTFAYTKRNDIIHKGRYGSTEADAKKAFESTIILINAIVDLLVDTREYIPTNLITEDTL